MQFCLHVGLLVLLLMMSMISESLHDEVPSFCRFSSEGSCSTSKYTVSGSSDNLAAIVQQFSPMRSISQIMIDNKLTATTALSAGKQLTLNCPSSVTWSTPQAACSTQEAAYQSTSDGLINGMSAVPTVAICPSGQFVTAISASPGSVTWSNEASEGGWVGVVSMTCSGGATLSLNAIPNESYFGPVATLYQSKGQSVLLHVYGVQVLALSSTTLHPELQVLGNTCTLLFHSHKKPKNTVTTGHDIHCGVICRSWINNIMGLFCCISQASICH